MPPPPVGSFAKITVVGDYQGQTIENTMVYKAETAATFSDVSPFHTAAVAYWNGVVMTGLLGYLNINYTFKELWSQIFTPTLTYVKQVFATTSTGIDEGTGLPSEVALVTKKITNYGGKKNRGRNYWAGLPASWVSATLGSWLPTSVADFNTLVFAAYTHVITTVSPANNWNPVVTDAAYQRFTLLVGGGYNSAPRVQRRRQIGRGI